MNLGIIAHNSKKVLIEDFCIAYNNILAKHEVYATGTTGRRIEEATSLHVHKFLAGSIGGDKQFMEMIARGDMATETDFTEPPVIQKRIIKTSNRLCKPAITATQMLESMTHQPLPTRQQQR